MNSRDKQSSAFDGSWVHEFRSTAIEDIITCAENGKFIVAILCLPILPKRLRFRLNHQFSKVYLQHLHQEVF